MLTLGLLGFPVVLSKGGDVGGRGMYRGAEATFNDGPACGDVLDALRTSSAEVLPGWLGTSCLFEPPATSPP